mgnify:CR=1 FL=1
MKVDQEKYWVILVLIAVIAFWAGGKDLNFNTQEMVEIDLIKAEENINDSGGENNKSDEIIVHIGGEVKHPGVFSFSKEARLIDAISIAGGETTKAALDRINLARKLNDGEHIIIPSFLSLDNSPDFSTNSFSDSNAKINLNQAGLEELSSLSGIGEVRANAIIEYRDNNNGFKEIEEIKNVSGIGIQTFNKIKDEIKI